MESGPYATANVQSIRGLIFIPLLCIIRNTGSGFRTTAEEKVYDVSDMLNRQKALIYILEQAARPVSRMELTKWCFLLQREMPSVRRLHSSGSFNHFIAGILILRMCSGALLWPGRASRDGDVDFIACTFAFRRPPARLPPRDML